MIGNLNKKLYLVFGVVTKIIEVEELWKKFVLIHCEDILVQIFRNYITRYSSVDRWYDVFLKDGGKREFKWVIKYYKNNEAVFFDYIHDRSKIKEM